jgi:hypothetical protein
MQAHYHRIVKKFVTDFHEEWVSMPRTPDEINAATAVYEVQGFPGAVGSVDCVHRAWQRCPYDIRHLHIGKEGFPTRAYEVIVDGVRRIRSVTPGFPGAFNDKTIVRYDSVITQMREGLYREETFMLQTESGERASHQGLYLLSDGGESLHPQQHNGVAVLFTDHPISLRLS